jgi:hypothetical protein
LRFSRSRLALEIKSEKTTKCLILGKFGTNAIIASYYVGRERNAKEGSASTFHLVMVFWLDK